MKAHLRSGASVHRLLGFLMVAHTGLVLGLLFLRSQVWGFWGGPLWFTNLWVALATLWFLWPLVLILHRGRSVSRVAAPLVLGTVITLFWISFYEGVGGPVVGLPQFVECSPASLAQYYVAYWQGRRDAKRDADPKKIVIEEFGGGRFTANAPLLSRGDQRRYRVEIRHTALCCIDERIVGHAAGYNEVAVVELKARFKDAVDW